MIIKEYIKQFRALGLGMFVHFGLYSILEQGEWAKRNVGISDDEYEPLAKVFCPDTDWADKLAKTAKLSGCRYITLTTRHHDGYSLFDTCGLNDYDSIHSCGRDLVKEFVSACRKYDIIPFFYHTLLDWYNKDYQNDFPKYLKYLRKSVELLCTNYGKIGGIWFDGMWDKPNDDWEEDALYGLIRSHQPEAMIINNTGLDARGALGHIELDSVTFERGKPGPINMEGSPKYVASEMCQVFCDHWGYAKRDLNYKSPAAIIEDLCACRRYGSNFLINVGPKADGNLRNIDSAMLELLGEWTEIYEEAIRIPEPSNITVKGNDKDFILQRNNVYYLFVHDIPMIGDPNVAINTIYNGTVKFKLPQKLTKAYWLDNGKAVEYTRGENDEITVTPLTFKYGENLVVRVARFEAE